MRKLSVLGVTLLLLAVVGGAGASPQRGYSFGRAGGNIVPYTVSIGGDGRVHVSGPATAGRMRLTSLQLVTLDRAVAAARFTSIPAVTNCPGTLPDIAATFIRVGPRTVRVHGSCVARYAKLFAELTRLVKLS